MENNDLWPDFNDIPKIVSPRVILSEQAGFLSEKTKQLVKGEVQVGSTGSDKIVYIFNISAPLLKNYKYQLFTISHDVFYYPCSLTYRGSITAIKDEDLLKQELARIFQDDKTVKVVQSLIGQSIDLSNQI